MIDRGNLSDLSRRLQEMMSWNQPVAAQCAPQFPKNVMNRSAGFWPPIGVYRTMQVTRSTLKASGV